MRISAILFCQVTVEGRAATTYGIRMHAQATYSPMSAVENFRLARRTINNS